jgi:hypothetical protein
LYTTCYIPHNRRIGGYHKLFQNINHQ